VASAVATAIAADECLGSLHGPALRITTPHIPLPAADSLEDHVLPSAPRIVATVREALKED
jgi:acetoin:2,6-dichlorophenolindophenol oxidoreductase subunit beta